MRSLQITALTCPYHLHLYALHSTKQSVFAAFFHWHLAATRRLLSSATNTCKILRQGAGQRKLLFSVKWRQSRTLRLALVNAVAPRACNCDVAKTAGAHVYIVTNKTAECAGRRPSVGHTCKRFKCFRFAPRGLIVIKIHLNYDSCSNYLHNHVLHVYDKIF